MYNKQKQQHTEGKNHSDSTPSLKQIYSILPTNDVCLTTPLTELQSVVLMSFKRKTGIESLKFKKRIMENLISMF